VPTRLERGPRVDVGDIVTTLPIAKLRAFARIRHPVAYYSRVVGVVAAGSGAITWTPDAPWEGPITPVSVEDYLRTDVKGQRR
jgi:hypothetical protein